MPPLTNLVPGNGTGTLSYTIPGSGLDVETVYADIDATAAGGDVTAELTIQDQSGVVIARKTQGSTVAAGGAGSATWGLRLDDAAGGGGGITQVESLDSSIAITNPLGPIVDLSGYKPPTAHEVLITNVFQNFGAGAVGNIRWNHNDGSNLLDLTNAVVPKVNVSGVYSFSGLVVTGENVAVGREVSLTFSITSSGAPGQFASAYTAPTGGQVASLGFSGTWEMATTDTLTLVFNNLDTILHTVGIYNVWVQKVS